MKKQNLLILPIFLIALISCKKSNTNQNNASLYIVAYQTDNLPGDGTDKHRVDAAICVWKESASQGIKVENDVDGAQGIGLDTISKVHVNATYFGSGDHLLVKNIPPGRYFVYVLDLYHLNVGNPLYSYKHFEVSNNQQLELDKTFDYPGNGSRYQAW
jgi:hypothetical protein